MSFIKTAAASVALLGLSAPAMAGEFFTGTRSESTRFDSSRVSTGHERISANRTFENKLKGSSHKHFVNVSASAENARMGGRSYGFVEGDSEINGDVAGTGAGLFGAGGGSLGEGGLGAFGGTGRVSSAGSVGSEFDGMIGTGGESYLDGSLQANAEWGGASARYEQEESGSSRFSSTSDFASVSNSDGTRSSGGSVFSFN